MDQRPRPAVRLTIEPVELVIVGNSIDSHFGFEGFIS
jgi:hypothetical protein